MAYDKEIEPKSRDLLVLEKARERIARGWCQNWFSDDRGGLCIIGALSEAVGSKGDMKPWAILLGFDFRNPASTWNDAPGRTQQEVLDRFDAAIERLSREP